MIKIDLDQITKEITKEIDNYSPSEEVENIGQIKEIGDGVTLVSGLSKAMLGEILEFPKRTFGLALNLKKEEVGVLILGDYEHLNEGDEVKTTGKILQIEVGDEMIGRVINPLGVPIDGRGEIKGKKTSMYLEKIAPGVIERKSVDTSLATGIKAIDSMVPIGRGQRELIIGDRGTGKTAITIDTIINQKGKNVICIYVAIGQKQSKVAQIMEKLKEKDAFDYTVIVAANASDSATLQYLAPYAGCAIGEYFMEKGKDALVIYDDLSKHAWAYRQISLLLKRPTGREAYPGDIFYLHSRLLERAAKMNEKNKGGSLTALPIIETQAGDISAYIPTNVISITDGQIFLESDLFYSGIRPAINVGLSVSRVGGAAQTKAMKQVAGKLRIDLAQYSALAAFAQFGSDLDKATRDQLDRGARITEILKQPQYNPLSLSEEILSIWVAVNGFTDDVPINKCQKFVEKYLEFLENENPQIGKEIDKEKFLSEKLIEKLKKVTEIFKTQWQTLETSKEE